MAIQKILDTDKLNTGWRTKYNQTVDEMIQAVTYVGNGILRFLKVSGSTFDVQLDGNKRADSVSVVEGENIITFPSAYDGVSWVFCGKPYLYDNSGVELAFTLLSKDETGFVINAVEAGTLEYQTTLI